MRRLFAALMAAVRLVAKLVWIPIQVAGKMAMKSMLLLERVIGSGGGEVSEECEAADHASRRAQAATQSAERALEAGDYASNLRSLARRRVAGREIDDTLWERLPEPLAAYVRGLNLAECEIVARQDLKALSEFLEGRLIRIPGVRTTDEMTKATPQRPNPGIVGTTIEGAAAFRAQIDAALAKARPALQNDNVTRLRA